MNKPTVTIITPLHNGARFIERAVNSVRAQSFSNWQHIVINDRSMDGGDRIARELSVQDPRLKVMESSASGAPSARNTGMLSAEGRYIAFLDCDDYWAPEKLETQVRFMQAEDLAFSWSAYDIMNMAGEVIRTQATHAEATPADLLTKRTVIGCLTAIYDRDRLGTMLMPQIRMRQDVCLFASILARSTELGLPTRGLQQPLAFHQLHDSNMTRNKARAALYQWRAYRDVFGLSLPLSAYYFSQYAVNSLRERAGPTRVKAV